MGGVMPLMGGPSWPTALMCQRGVYRGCDGSGRYWMAPDPSAPPPTVRAVLWLAVLVGWVVWAIGSVPR